MRCNPISYNTNLYFGNELAKLVAERAADNMKLNGIRNSLNTDKKGNINDYDGTSFREEDAYPILDKLEKEFSKQDITGIVDTLEWYDSFMENLPNHPLSKDNSLPENTRNALILGYLNRLVDFTDILKGSTQGNTVKE